MAGEWLNTPPAAAPPAVPEAPAEPSVMVGSDGKLYKVPAASTATALKNGWHPATPEEIAREDRIKAGVAEKEASPVATTAKQFGNEAALGIPQLISDKEASPEEAAIQQQIRERYEAQNPVKSGLAKGAGFVAPLLIPGVGEAGDLARLSIEGAGKLAAEGVAREAEASLGRKIAGSAAKYATEGALYSSPQAAVQAAYGDPEQAAETMLWGIGLSGALGAGGRLVGEGVGAAKRLTAPLVDAASEKLSAVQPNGVSYVDDIARNVLGVTDKQAMRLGPTRLSRIVERADQEGLLAASPADRPARIKAMLGDAGSKLGEHQEALDKLLEDPELRQHGPVPTKIAAEFQDEVLAKHPELMSELHSTSLSWASKIEQEIGSGGNEPSFEALQRIRKNISSAVKDFAADSTPAKIVRLADSVIKRGLEDSAQSLYEAGKLPEKFADYLAQKERYEAGKQLAMNLNPFKGSGRIPGGMGSIGLGKLAQVGFGAMHGPVGLGLAGLNIAREYAMKAFLKNEGGLLGKSVSFLRKVAADPATAPYVGGFMAKEGVSALGAHLDALPSYLSGSKVVARGTADVVSHLTGASSTGLSKSQQYDKVVDAIRSAQTETSTTAGRVGGLASTFTGTNIKLASLVADKKLQAIGYLASQIPTNPNGPRAFQRSEWKPTGEQQKDFLRKCAIVQDPMLAWKHYQDGTLSRADRDTLRAVYPSTYRAMVSKIMATAYDPRAPELDYAKRMQLSMFTGQPLDDSLKNLAAIQTAVSQPQSSQQPAPQNQGKRAATRPKLKSPSLQTDTQRRTAGVATS